MHLRQFDCVRTEHKYSSWQARANLNNSQIYMQFHDMRLARYRSTSALRRNAMAGNGFHRCVGWGVVADRETSAAADGPCVAMYNYCRKLFPFFATPSHPYG